MVLRLPVPDLVSLDLLRSVDELGSITKAAQAHRLSQPAASMRLRDLERTLGVRLLERRGGGSRLSGDGKVILGWAEKILDQVGALQEAVYSLRHDVDHRLSIGASLTVAEYLMPDWLVKIRSVAPTTSISLRMGNSAQICDAVRANDVELGFLEGARNPDDLEARYVRNDLLRVVVSRSHNWAKRRANITVEELCSTPILVRESGSGTKEVLDQALGALGQTASVFAELSSTTAIKSAIRSGLAPAVMSELVVSEELRSGDLVAIDVDGLDLTRTIRVVFRGDRVRSRAAKTFLTKVLGVDVDS